MRKLVVLVLFVVLASVASAQKKDDFPLTAKVLSSTEETAPGTGGVTTVATSPEVRAQFPNSPATHAVRVLPRTYISTKVELEDNIYVLSGGKMVAPGNYPASVDGRTVRLLTKDKRGKPKILKFHTISVAAKQDKNP